MTDTSFIESEERQALREKHCDNGPGIECDYCMGSFYPCDVIKVLDATEPSEKERWLQQ